MMTLCSSHPSHRRYALPAMALAVLACAAAWPATVAESARDIPVAYDVDVVVVGGGAAAVAAAIEASDLGADVFVAAPRPYLGEDLCATYRLWLEPDETPATPLAEALFKEPPAPLWVGKGLPFTYETDVPSGGAHPDTAPPSKLGNGNWDSAFNESVEYPGAVTITLDLGEPKALQKIHAMVFQRNEDIELSRVTFSVSNDKTTWEQAAVVPNDKLGQGEYVNAAIYLSAPVTGTWRYVRVFAEKPERAKRLLLGEIVAEPAGPAVERPEGSRIPPMPMQIKRTLDQALLDANVQFLYGCYATEVLRDASGNVAGIVMTNRSGRQAVRAKVVIDATTRAAVARMAGASFAPYPAGPQTFQRIVVGGAMSVNEGVRGRTLPAPVQIEQRGIPENICQNAYEYTLTIPMRDGSFASFAEADQIARDLTWDPGQVAASEELFQVPPDPMKGQASSTGPWPGAASADLNAFRPAGVPGLYVLGGCADVSREAAAQLLRPLALMDLGARIGRVAAADAQAAPKPAVVCFGDSITASVYPAKLGRLLGHATVINAGVGGNTTGQGLARLEADVLSRHPAVVVLLFGTNDSAMTAPQTYRTPLDQYEANLREMVARCREAGAKVVLCTIPPILAEPYFGRHPKECYDAEGGLDAILERYRAACLRVATSLDAPVVDLYTALGKDLATLGIDGVHPSPHGTSALASLVAAAVSPLLPPRGDLRPEGVHLPGAAAVTASEPGEVRELLEGLRPFQSGLPTVPSEARTLPVLGAYDVVVVGGGTGGAPAGIGAARQGVKTLVIEYQCGLGGVSTLGLIGSYYHGYRGGFTKEMDWGVARMGAVEGTPNGSWNVKWKMEWYRYELLKAGASIWFETLGCGAVVEDGRVKGVVVTTPSGRGIVLAKVVIDATGNSDIAAAAGAQCVYTDGSNVAMQGTGMPPRHPLANYTNTDYTIVDDSDMLDVWRIQVAGKAKYESAYDMGQLVDTRERRRIVGDYVLSPLDIYNGRTFPDTVVLSMSDFDTHGFTIHPLFSLLPPDKKRVSAYTPYRCMMPKGLEGILVTGLGISAHRDAMPILRMQPDIQNQGYGMGVAAAMAAKADSDVREIDVKALQRHLVEKECLPENVLTDVDSYPLAPEVVAAAVKSVANGYEGLSVLLAQWDQAQPLLRAAYAAADASPEAKLIYAHILGMMGDPAGADTLLEYVTNNPWDSGWSFTGGGQFGMSVSPMDSRIIALGLTRDKRGVAPILVKAAALDATSPFSHHRAVAEALEAIGDPQAAAPLAALLGKPGMRGHAYLDIADATLGALEPQPNLMRDVSLRELSLARALYRCGDCDGLGKTVLLEYAKDLRGLQASHATAVLNEKRGR